MADSSNTAVVSATELVVDYGHRLILDQATLAINEGDRVGMVGRNGSGKTTFLKILGGELEPDSGEVTRRKDLVTGYLPQSFSLNESSTAYENIMAGAKDLLDLIHEYENSPSDSAQHEILFEQINHFDGWNLEHRAKSLMTHLNAPSSERIVNTLSGGEKRRVALCKALLARPDFLILDEPTNHLDTDSIEWLEEYLSGYPGACLFVTHDRYFLDRIATRMVELSRGKFISYPGTYTDFLEAKAERVALEEQQENSRQGFLKRELEWVRRRPRARRTKSKDRVERFHVEAAREGPEVELNVDLVIPPAPRLADRVIELTNVSMDLGGKSLFKDFNLKLQAGSRVGIVGRNGLGKTTLLKIMMGQLAPSSGKAELGTQTKINYIDQGRLLLDEQKTILQEVSDGGEYVALGEEKVSIRGYLRRFLFTEDRMNAKISLLSGGERSRVILAKILKRGGNVIILDEPTNDLDLATLRILEEALMAFKGTVVAVSHDRYFLNRICTSIVGFEGDGQIFQTIGSYDYYLEKRPIRKAEALDEEDQPTTPVKKERAKKMKWKEEKELEGMEGAIQATEAEVLRIQALFQDPEFYKKHGDQWEELDRQLVAAKEKVKTLYSRWEELEQIKAETNQK
jgi:ABC transport system ATP-binding/permease protein